MNTIGEAFSIRFSKELKNKIKRIRIETSKLTMFSMPGMDTAMKRSQLDSSLTRISIRMELPLKVLPSRPPLSLMWESRLRSRNF
jgi:hypothetical protein